MSFPSGKHLHHGKYIVERELGSGGFGITYKATNTVLNHVVVIKTVNDALRQDPNFFNHQQQFQAEARRLAKCAHPSIVRVTDFFVEEGLPFIVMDYVPGQTLDTVILPNNPLPEDLALYYIRQVGDAVKTIHQNGLLHRDIKPQNLILREGTQQIVLIDFGIAREFTPGQTQVHTHLVSEGYAPIEQYLPQAKRSPATDIYGLAATLYTLLTGRIPVAAPLRDRCPLTELRHLQPGVSASVNAAVMRGMAMEPLHRPETVEAWLALLPEVGQYRAAVPLNSATIPATTVAVAPAHRVAHSLPTEVATAAIAPPAQQNPAQKRRWLLPGLIGFSALASFALGYGLWRSQASQPTAQPTPVNPSAPPVAPAIAPTTSPRRDLVRPPEASPQPLDEPAPPDPLDADPAESPAATPDSELTPEPAEPPPPPAPAPAPIEAVTPEPQTGAREAEPPPPPPPLPPAEEPAGASESPAEDAAREDQQQRDAS